MRFTVKFVQMQDYYVFDNMTQHVLCCTQSELAANRIALALNQQNEREIAGVLLGG